MRFEIVEQGDLVPQEVGRYVSFPSLAKDPKTGDVLILYRRATYDEGDLRPGMRAHGLDGDLYLKRLTSPYANFSTEKLLVSGKSYSPGLIDGVLSTMEDSIILLIRRYPQVPPVFYTKGASVEALGSFQVFPSHQCCDDGAQWGRIISLDRGRKRFQVFYGGCNTWRISDEDGPLAKYLTRPALFQSVDGGESWEFLSWIAPLYVGPGMVANETTLTTHNGVLYALMRTHGEYPGPMLLSTSDDEGQTWSPPVRSGLYGEAPMFYTVPSGKILVGFRGFLPETPQQGGTFSIACFDPDTHAFSSPFVVEPYHGNHYDGGYGDLIWVEALGQLLVVYYYSNQPVPRNPWLRYAFLKPIS